MGQRFKGPNFSLLGDLQGDYDANQRAAVQDTSLALREQALTQRANYQDQSLALREQFEGMREEHQNQVAALAEKAAAVHDEYVSAQLAKSSAQLERAKMQHQEATQAWGEVAGLDPKKDDYPAQVARIGAKYATAFAKSEDGTENGLLEHVKSLDEAHSKWSDFTMKGQQEQARMTAANAAAVATGLKPTSMGVSGSGQSEIHFGGNDRVISDYAKAKAAEATFAAQMGAKDLDETTKAGYAASLAGAKVQREELERQYPTLANPSAPIASPIAQPAPANRPPLDDILGTPSPAPTP